MVKRRELAVSKRGEQNPSSGIVARNVLFPPTIKKQKEKSLKPRKKKSVGFPQRPFAQDGREKGEHTRTIHKNGFFSMAGEWKEETMVITSDGGGGGSGLQLPNSTIAVLFFFSLFFLWPHTTRSMDNSLGNNVSGGRKSTFVTSSLLLFFP